MCGEHVIFLEKSISQAYLATSLVVGKTCSWTFNLFYEAFWDTGRYVSIRKDGHLKKSTLLDIIEQSGIAERGIATDDWFIVTSVGRLDYLLYRGAVLIGGKKADDLSLVLDSSLLIDGRILVIQLGKMNPFVIDFI